jgi:surface polysaccharide O-acyltransferase-like enzyme
VPPAVATRHAGLDRLKAGTTLLVVLHHTAIVYGGSGSWYWRELPTSERWSSLLLTFFCAVNQAWFMGLFFLLAGYFTPGALQAKGTAAFVRDRLLRLGLPLLVYGFVIGPATIALAQTARGRDFGATLLQLWQRPVFEAGPLWFAWALLLFTAAALLRGRFVAPMRPADPAAPWPRDSTLLAAALAVAAVAFALRLAWPVGTTLAALQIGYFASYAALFAFGYHAAGARLLERVPPGQARRWRRVAAVTLPVLAVVALAAPQTSALAGRAEGGLSVPAAVYALWEPLVAWGVIGTLLLRAGRATTSPLWDTLARRAFAVYVVHPAVVVGISLALHGWAAPPLLKFACAGVVSCALCVLLAGGLLRVPLLRRVL